MAKISLEFDSLKEMEKFCKDFVGEADVVKNITLVPVVNPIPTPKPAPAKKKTIGGRRRVGDSVHSLKTHKRDYKNGKTLPKVLPLPPGCVSPKGLVRYKKVLGCDLTVFIKRNIDRPDADIVKDVLSKFPTNVPLELVERIRAGVSIAKMRHYRKTHAASARNQSGVTVPAQV